MAVYEAFASEDKQPSCPPHNPCCEEPCDEPSFWELLPCRRLNWIALGLAALAIGFGLIGLGYINVGTTINIAGIELPPPALVPLFDSTLLTQGTRLITHFLGVILVSAWLLFKACSDDWKTVVVGSLIGASGFPLAAIGLLYMTVAQFNSPAFNDPASNHTWFNIALSLITASIVGFLFLAYFIYANRCFGCITAKKGVVVSLIFLSGGWAAWSLGRLLWVAIVTFQFFNDNFNPPPPGYVFPSSAFMAFTAVSVVNIVLVVALGWYIITCSVDNCYTTFLPLFASVASLGNWALYRVGLNVVSFAEIEVFPPAIIIFPPATVALLPRFAYAIGFISITALLLTFVIANGNGDGVVVFVASAITLLYPIATYTYVATAYNLFNSSLSDFVTSMLQGIFLGIALTAILAFVLRSKASCPISKIIYGLGAGTFGWAVIYLYSTYSADILTAIFSFTTTTATLNIGLVVVISAAIFAVLYAHFIACDELLSAITFLNIALLTAGAGGFIGTIAFYQAGVPSLFIPISPLRVADIRAATTIYVIYVLLALILPRFFAKCSEVKRQLVIAIASLGFGIAAVDLGRAIAFARAIAFTPHNLNRLTFSPMIYIASAIGAVLAGQAVVWAYPQANVYTALIPSAIGLVVEGIALQVIFFVDAFNSTSFKQNTELIGLPWLIFTLAIVALLVFLEFKSLCIPQHCRFLVGLLIPVLGMAVFGKIAGASAALGTAFNIIAGASIFSLPAFAYTSRLILVNSIIPLAGFLLSLQAFNCTSCLAYLPSTITFIAVVYVTSQFQILSRYQTLAIQAIISIPPPFFNLIAAVYFYFNLTNDLLPPQYANNAAFINQVSLVYIHFLAPALIAGFVFSCSRRVTAATIGSAIAATVISFGAFGVATVIVGVFIGVAFGFNSVIRGDITATITFAQFLQGINSQFVLLAVGVLTALFIYFDKCRYPSC